MLKFKSHRLIMSEKKTPSCHASTVLPLKDGRVLAAWFGGSGEGRTDVGIWLAEKDEKGFKEARVVAQSLLPHWNPVLYQCDDGRIVLFYKVGMKILHWKTMFIESFDGGKTFSEPRELVPGDVSGGRGPVRNKPIRLKNGRILAPASTEQGLWRCFIDISDDDGHTWRKSNMIEVPGLEEYEKKLLAWQKLAEESDVPVEKPEEIQHGRGIIQPTLWESEHGVHALMRSGEGFIYRSDSTDGGETWCAAYPTNLPNNNSGIDLTKLGDGTLLLVFNPVQESWGMRTPISIAASTDNGETWTRLCDLQTEPGEFSYPAIVNSGNKIYITYTYKRENIAYWEFVGSAD